jgi:hypothetical protein
MSALLVPAPTQQGEERLMRAPAMQGCLTAMSGSTCSAAAAVTQLRYRPCCCRPGGLHSLRGRAGRGEGASAGARHCKGGASLGMRCLPVPSCQVASLRSDMIHWSVSQHVTIGLLVSASTGSRTGSVQPHRCWVGCGQAGPIALRCAKAAINQGLGVDLQTGLALERSYYAQVQRTLLHLCTSG